ncbi:uncharacterized protein GGS22DRAFT_158018 [Annulohypoxylon maeteangense]|uniref:uncharacterized protein n=1 Tax=Annulohypoxylon maeteangense TaxID=1927788 RepID=UPI0020087CFA|nr:uncharacterized protein GGS22DRAFT_158018 [Annulohypoxylon maeteangense]KAI0886507.1 hypothetical protein GGS22DRAFT_158018 [Annulohypoxylon maeteangense]
MGVRPKGLHIKHLTELERFRVRTLYFDAGMSKPRIKQVTGYSTSQIRTAVHAETAAVAPRSGRPKRGPNGETPAKKQKASAGPSSQDTVMEESPVAQGDNTAQASNRPPSPDVSLQLIQKMLEQQSTSPSLPTSPAPPSSSATPSMSYS